MAWCLYLNQLPKLVVVGSNPIARSNVFNPFGRLSFLKGLEKIAYWPTAMQMLNPRKDYLKKRSRRFLEHLALRYRSLSKDHHMSGAGVIRVYAKLLIDEKMSAEDQS